jgi:hypothetical protein
MVAKKVFKDVDADWGTDFEKVRTTCNCFLYNGVLNFSKGRTREWECRFCPFSRGDRQVPVWVPDVVP